MVRVAEQIVDLGKAEHGVHSEDYGGPESRSPGLATGTEISGGEKDSEEQQDKEERFSERRVGVIKAPVPLGVIGSGADEGSERQRIPSPLDREHAGGGAQHGEITEEKGLVVLAC